VSELYFEVTSDARV